MSDTLHLTLAVPREIVDNNIHDRAAEVLGAVGLMKRESSGEPVWGTSDKALLAGLIERGRAGDLGAMEALYGMFKGPVFSLMYRHTANRAVAEDLLQDVFLKIFSHLRDVRDAATFSGWVFRIALNTCYSHLRQKKAQAGRDVPLDGLEGRIADDAAAPVERDLKGPLEQAVKSLPAGLRTVFLLHDVQGYKHEEIARLMKCSAGTSKSQLFKARMRLRAVLRARKAV